MFEWWQTVALSLGTLVVGGVIAVSSAYVQRRWAKSDTLEADSRASLRRLEEGDREAMRRKEAEEREARREWRRERVKPLRDFVEMAKRYDAAESLKGNMKAAWEMALADLGIKDQASLEPFRKVFDESPKFGSPDFYELFQAGEVAIATSLTAKMTEQTVLVWLGAGKRETEEDRRRYLTAVISLEHLIEDYVAKV